MTYRYITEVRPILLGKKGENGVTTIRFPINIFFPNIPRATYTLWHQRQGDVAPYPCVISVWNGFIDWVISLADVDRPGSGVAQLIAWRDGVVEKTVIFTTVTLNSLELTDPPEPQKAWLDQVTEAAANAFNSATQASEYAKAAQDASEAIQNLDVEAEQVEPDEPADVVKVVDPITGAVTLIFKLPGVTIGVQEIEGGHRVTISDMNGTRGFDVMDGVSPENPVLSVNGMTGEVELDAEDVGAVPTDDYAPVDKTEAMTQPVGKGPDGKLYTTPSAGAVSSVNGQTGDVELDAQDVGALPDNADLDDIADGATYKRATATQLSQIAANANDIDAIEEKIPSAASSSNQLADKAYVADSIIQGTAIYRGAFASHAALLAVAWQTTNPDAENYVSNNDYTYVLDDETHDDECWRYLYVTGTGWTAQIRVNESPLTQAQLDALNSGATAAIISSVADKLDKTGDGSNVTATFSTAASRANIATGEKLSVIFGKIAKWFSDFGTAAFRAATNAVTQGSTDLVESGAVYTAVSAKYTKPPGGIPASDLAPGVIPDGYPYTPENYGAVGDGVADDLWPLRDVFSAATAAGKPVVMTEGAVYGVSDEVSIIGRIPVMGNGATIRAISGTPRSVLRVVSRQGQEQFPESQGMGLLENLTIDGGGYAGYALLTDYAQGGMFRGLDICGFTIAGIYLDHGFGQIYSDIRIGGSIATSADIAQSASAIGIDLETNDCHFSDIEIKNVGTGIKIAGAANFFSRVHVWSNVSGIAQTAVGFDAYAYFTASECYFDTCATAVKLRSAITAALYGCFVLYGGSTIMGAVAPTVFSIASAAYAANIAGFGLNVDAGDCTDFSLFDTEPTTTFDWAAENTASVRDLVNCPASALSAYRTAAAQDVIDAGKLGTSGDGSDVTVAFTAASSRTAIATGEKLSVLFGKILKWLSDLGTAAFRAATATLESGSTALIESGAVFTALAGKLSASTKYASSQSVGGPADKTVSIPMGAVDGTSTDTAFTATIPGITELRDGVLVWLKNGVVTSAAGCTLNINGLGAKPIYNSIAAATATTTTFNVNYTMLFVFNSTRVTGGCWDMVYGYDSNTTYTPVKLGFGYAACTTAAATAAKTASLSSYTLTANGLVAVKFSYDVPASATLNINSKGAKAIYYKDAAITAGVIKGGDTALFVYSTYYRLLAIDRWGTDITSILTALDNKQAKITASGVLKGDGNGGVSAAVAGTDYGTYSKPSGGIPASDLAQAVQTSLGKADTALQSAPVTSVNGQTGAVMLSIPSTAADIGACPTVQHGSISLSATWSGSGPYTQTVTVTGATVTANSKVDLQPDATALAQLITDSVKALYVANNAGTLTATAIGAATTAALTIQCTVTEVSA